MKYLISYFIYYFSVYLNRGFFKIFERKKFKNFNQISEDIHNYGVCVLPDFIKFKQIKLINDELIPLKELILNRDLKGYRYNRNRDQGYFRLFKLKKLSKFVSKFFFNMKILDFSKYYISQSCEYYQDMLQLKQQKKKNLKDLKYSSDGYHIDDWKIRLKFFLVLSDVTMRDGPMRYIKGSHKLALFKKKKEYFDNGKKGNYGHFTKKEVSKIKKKFKLKEAILACKRGTLIIADGRGIHRGTPLERRNNPRTQLSIYSDIRKVKWNPKNFDG